MLICPNCSTRNNDYHIYCYHCGTKLKQDTSLVESQESPELPWDMTGAENLEKENDLLSDIVNLPEETDEEESGLDEPIESVLQDNTSLPNYDNYFGDSFKFDTNGYNDEDYDIQDRLPLRRYRKSEKDERVIEKLIRASISILLIAFIGFMVYVGYDQMVRKPAGRPAATAIDYTYKVEETELDGMPARRILIESSVGEQIQIQNQLLPFIQGKAELVLPDSDFIHGDYAQSDGVYKVSLPIIIAANGYPHLKENIEFDVPVHNAPLEILSPAEKEALAEGDSFPLMLQVEPGSEVFVNDYRATHLLDEQGQLTMQLEVPEEPENIFEIRVETRGYSDTVETIVLKRQQMAFPLSIDQDLPITASGSGEWVEITGNTAPDAVLTANLEMLREPEIDPVTGDFSFYIKASAKGMTPLILTAKLNDLESVLEAAVERPATEMEYTTKAWAFNYQEMKEKPHLHNGRAFAITGTITELSTTGSRTIITLDIARSGQASQPVHVEYWKPNTLAEGQEIRVFGNYWGSRNDMPYIIAYFIY
ncbi:MAG: zinc ribbon domain-containing protein [Clostridiales bacterium]|jgi:hypothetical protein|nr:zinc ribbon domain-containing protein [Clostridiales bacterium]